MAKGRRLEWHKEKAQVFQVRFHDELDAGVTLSDPSVRVDELTKGSDPEDWDDISTSGSVSVSGVLVVDAYDDDGTAITNGTSQAVQFTLDADSATMPDETDEPVPGKNYRVVVMASRSDAGGVVGKVGLTIRP